MRIEDFEALGVEPLVGAGDRRRQRLLGPNDAVAQEAVDDLEKLRPFAEPRGELRQICTLARNLILRQPGRNQAQRLPRLHGVDLLAQRRRGQDAIDARRDEPDAVRPALQKRLEVLLAPRVVDHHENPAVAERLAQLRRGGVERLQARPLASQEHDEVGEGRDQALGLLAELGPQDAVEIGVLDVGVVGERLGERRLAVAAGPAQRGRDPGDGITPGVEELLFQRVEFLRAPNKVGRRLRRHHRHALLPALGLNQVDECRFLLGKIEVVGMADPARHDA